MTRLSAVQRGTLWLFAAATACTPALAFGAGKKVAPADDFSGVDLHGETFSIRPAVEFTRYLYNFSGGGSSSSDGFTTVNVLVHLEDEPAVEDAPRVGGERLGLAFVEEVREHHEQ